MTNVYLITNVVNNNMYVGITDSSIEERLKQHINESRKSGAKRVLQRAIIAHGANNFQIKLLETFEQRTIALQREKFWINLFKAQGHILYNSTDGGEDGKLSADTKLLISQRTKEAMQSPSVKARIRASRLGRKRGPMSAETKQKISQANKGRKLREDVIHKLKQRTGALTSNFGKTFTKEHRQRQSDSIQRYFASLTETERQQRRQRIKDRMNDPQLRNKISQRTLEGLKRAKEITSPVHPPQPDHRA